MCNNFESTLKNPIIPNESGNTSDPFIVYENGRFYQPCGKDGNLYVLFSESIKGLATAFSDGNFEIVYTADAEYSEFYAPEIHKMDDGHWYIYVAPQYDTSGRHKTAVIKSNTDRLFDGFENSVVLMDYTADVFLSIDGTVLKFGGKNYFIWSEQTCMKIAEMESPTKLKTEQISFLQPEYDWEKFGYSLVEGPAILYDGDRIFLTYSASDSQSDNYAIGLCEFSGDNPLNPESWKRVYTEPVISKTPDVFGPGHNSFLTLRNKNEDITYIVYHAHLQSTDIIGNAWNGRTVFIQRVTFDGCGYPKFMKPSEKII